MKRCWVLIALIALVFVRAQAQQFSPLCVVTGTLYNPDGSPARNVPLLVMKVQKTGAAFVPSQKPIYSDATTGAITFTVPRGSTAWLYCEAYIGSLYLGKNGGVSRAIPNAATATLESLGEPVTGTAPGVTVRDEGTGLATLVNDFDFVGSGVSVSQPSGGKATVTITGGGGGGSALDFREADGSPSITGTTMFEFNQAAGFVLTDQGSNVTRLDLSGVPYSKLNLSGSIVDADVSSSAAIAESKIAGLVTDLAGKASASHTHSESDITNLVADLAGKAAASHTHVENDITNLVTDLAGKVPTTRQILTGNGLQNGGDLSADRTLNLLLNASGGLSKTLGGGSNELGIAAAGVLNSMLANSSVTINGTANRLAGGGSVSLGGSLTLNIDTTLLPSPLVGDAGKFLKATAANAYTPTAITESDVGGLVSDLAGKQATGNYITGLTGDVTASGPGSAAATIANNAVTFAKMQNISTNVLLGRSTASTGNIETIAIGSGLSLSGGTLSASGGGGTPGGSNTQLQYNNSSAFGGISGVTSDGTNVTAGSGNLRATLPRITTGLDDANGNSMLAFTATASAVNGLTLINAATGGTVSLRPTGSDSSINFNISPKISGNNGSLTLLDDGTIGLQAIKLNSDRVGIRTTGSAILQFQDSWFIGSGFGSLWPSIDNSMDFGTSGNKIRTGYFGTSVESAVFKTTTSLVTATDGGSTASFVANMVGSTGGPTTATQNGWMKMKDSGGNTVWVPVWK